MTLLPIPVTSGYNVAGDTSGIFPECGTPTDETGDPDRP